MLAGFTLVALDLGRLWHQTYAFYGGFEPITLELVSTIANDTLWGSGWKLQALSAAVVGVGFGALRRGWPAAWVAAAPAGLVTMASRPLTGHAVEQGSWLSLPALLQMVHVLGAALWIGTLLAMTAVGLRRLDRLDEPLRAPVIAALVSSFSPLALSAAAALFVAGCATSFQYLGGFTVVFTTVYGRVLGAKVLAFGAVIGLGYYNWQRVRPAVEASSEPDSDRARALLLRTAGAELCVALVVLALTAVLVALPMPMG